MTNSSLVIDNVVTSQDQDGRYCLNDLHRAASAAFNASEGRVGDLTLISRWKPSDWMRLDQTKELVKVLQGEIVSENPETASRPVKILQGGTHQGTYVCKELVYAYAMWISPQFNLKVIRAYDQMYAQPVALPMDEEEVAQLYLAAIQEKKRLQRQIASSVLTPRPTFEENAEGIALQRIKREIAPYLSIKVIAHVLKHFGQKRTFVQYGEHENQVVKPFVREGVEYAIKQFLEQADYRISYSRKTVVLTHDCLLGDEAQVSAEDAIAHLGYAPADFGI